MSNKILVAYASQAGSTATIEIKKQEDQMTPEIKTINFGGINCYLVKTDIGELVEPPVVGLLSQVKRHLKGRTAADEHGPPCCIRRTKGRRR